MPEIIEHTIVIPPKHQDWRLDKSLSHLLPQYSRSLIQSWIKSNKVKLDHEIVNSPKLKINAEQTVIIETEIEAAIQDKPENIELDIIDEDDDILVINKPVGLVVHPGAGNRTGTLLNALLHHAPKLKNVPRAGIVHRLDKDTSGLLVIAKTLESHLALIKMLQKRDVHREYEAIVLGTFTGGGKIDAPIGRHPKKRTHMAIVDSGKPAITHYRVLDKFHDYTHLQLNLETGRTHQIRVHMASIKHPIVGDPVYGGRLKLPKGASDELIDALRNFKHQALHARKLGLHHPVTNTWMEWQAKPPKDFSNLLELLKIKNL